MPDHANAKNQYTQASIATADNLRQIAHTLMKNRSMSQLALPQNEEVVDILSNMDSASNTSPKKKDVSQLTLPEINEAVDIVSEMVPAGNVPGIILNGLARLSGNRPPKGKVQKDIRVLFRGVSQVLDTAVFSAMFAGPAAVIWGYQNLLKLAGKKPEDAFPEGTWQFYVDYAMREDTARHANETHGFDTILTDYDINVTEIDRVSAWVMTAVDTLVSYDALLANEWRERIQTRVLSAMMQASPNTKKFNKAFGRWQAKMPYGRRADAGQDTYTAYRKRLFNTYMQDLLSTVPQDVYHQWHSQVEMLTQNALPAYQQQMSILSYLDPDEYSETRTPYSLADAHIGIIHQNAYYLLPVMQNANNPVDIHTVRRQVAAILNGTISNSPSNLSSIATIHRAYAKQVITSLPDTTQHNLRTLRYAPIFINTDQQNPQHALATIRQAERGVGDHALTIFDTGKTFVFDQSHIYFDGAWGAALAEIMTNEALSWARYLASLPPADTRPRGIKPLHFEATVPTNTDTVKRVPRVPLEASAESDDTNIQAILTLRKTFKQRNDLLQLTVNDLLVLYRAIHAVTYRPSQDLLTYLEALTRKQDTETAARTALTAINKRDNPDILIPVDASPYNPAERLYPMSFRVPLLELDLLDAHQHTLSALEKYKQTNDDRSEAYKRFDNLQRDYLGKLAGFGAVLTRAKEIATSGESASVGTIKLLAHMPPALQKLLDGIPSRIDKLNDIIKGKEVFSNVGAVAPTSTLTRFITAKDDNEKKTLAWGVITDAEGVMRITLRDFRPHVGHLHTVGEHRLADRITQDYLDTYVNGLNTYIRELRRITLASRETRLSQQNNGDNFA